MDHGPRRRAPRDVLGDGIVSTTDPPPSQSQIAPGYRLDRYEMLCPIAEGGMASVWVARLRGKRGFEKLVAIKTILPKFASDPRFEQMFLDEAGLAARIEHANVAQVLDLGEEHEVLYLAMELVDGDSLSKLLRVVQRKELTIPIGILLRIMADTCGGLHAAHEVRGKDGDLLNVVHRDVSPQNILVTMNGVAKLIDFGIAKARDRMSEDTNDGVLKGKIHYMAPEQAVGQPVDRRADVFAVGAILYFVLAGTPAFAGENHLATLFRLSAGRPPLPLPKHVPASVSAAIMRALAHDPAKRFATAAEMQAALEAAMGESGLMTTTVGVSAFVQEHMAERAKKRREGMDLALGAAAQREKVARVLELVGADSSSGHRAIDPGDIPVVDDSYATVMLGAPPASEGPRPSLSESSSATLGSALASPVPVAGLPRRVGWVAVVTAVVGAAVVVGALIRVGTHAPASSAAPPSPIVAAPVVARPPPPATSDTSPWHEEIPPPVPSASAAPEAPPSAKPVVKRPAVYRPPPPSAPTATTKHRINDGF
jgi:hypothetical protein